MATRLPDGSILMSDGRVLYANSVILAQDLLELMPLFTPPPAWPFISGGGGGPGPQGPAGPAGTGGGGGGGGSQGNQGFQGTNPGPAGPQGAQGNQGVAGAGVQGAQGNQGGLGLQGNQGNQGVAGAGVQGPQGNQGGLGVQGSQGNQGVAGAGVQGPQGSQGNQGVAGAGVQGAQGFQGLDGPQGNQGAQGFQGITGAGVQGAQGIQGPGGAGSDIFAATRVVSLVAGEGTDLTVAAAIAALPAAGGRIYVKEGTFALAATNTMPDKPVDIIGSGDGTIFDLGANAIFAFTIPDGLTAQRNYSFQNFKVIGNSVAAQGVLSIQDSNAFGVSTLKSLRTEGVRTTISILDGDGAFLTPVLVSVYDSWFVPVAAGNSVLCDSNGNSFPMDVAFYSTRFMVDDFSGIGGTINADSFGSLNAAFFDCHLSLTGEDGLSSIHAERCKIFNFSGTPEITFLNGNFSSDDDLPQSAFINCNVLGIWIVDGGGLNITGGWWTNCRVETGLVNGRSSIVGVSFRADGTSAATVPVDGGNTCAIEHSGQDLSVIGCTFSASGFALTNYIRVVSDIEITDCDFRGMTGASDSGVRITGVNNHLNNNSFDTDNWGCPPVREVGGTADRNVYSDNLGLNGNPVPLVGGAGVNSIFVGVRNTFNGVSQFQATAATTDAFVVVNVQRATSGVVGIATIKNTGANGMNVRETGVDQFGVTSTVTTLVAAGGDLRLDPTVNIGTARPPYSSYQIEVQSSAAGLPTTYVLRLGMNGQVSW